MAAQMTAFHVGLSWRAQAWSTVHVIRHQQSFATSASRKPLVQSADQQFQEHFAAVYGNERWDQLWSAMQRPTQHVAFSNPFASVADHTANFSADQQQYHQLTAADQVCLSAGWHRIHSSLPFYTIIDHCNGNSNVSSISALHDSAATPDSTQESDPQPSADGLLQLGHTAVDAASGCQLLYFLDLASALPALALNPQPGMKVLDMCAAPGGKSLLLASQLLGKMQLVPHVTPSSMDNRLYTSTAHAQQQHQVDAAAEAAVHSNTNSGRKANEPNATSTSPSSPAPVAAAAVDQSHLTSNDRSPARRVRLRSVLHSYIPQQYHQQLHVTGHDATRWHQYHSSAYDAVLVDAPCSSERHLAQRNNSSSSSTSLITKQNWSVSRSKRNASVQVSLLVSAAQSVVPGGRVVYSTCSINPAENDQVVQKACAKLRRLGITLECITSSSWQQLHDAGFMLSGVEGDGVGMWALPDRTGWGPIYWCVLQRTL